MNSIAFLIVWMLPFGSAQSEPRLRPPSTLNCPPARGSLTAYSGTVVGYNRGQMRTTLRIKTDWETTEEVVLDHKGSNPMKWFLYGGEPLSEADWQKITDAVGRPRPGTRATAWICGDGSNPIVDWERPKK